MTEEQLQSTCTQWFWNTFPEERRMLFHVDNNSWNSIIGAKKKALGVVSGVSDLIYVLPLRVVFLECKVEKNTQSDEQKEFESRCEERGHDYYIFRSFEEFKDIIAHLQELSYG